MERLVKENLASQDLIATWISWLSSVDEQIADPVIEALGGALGEQLRIVEATPEARFAQIHKNYAAKREQDRKILQAFATAKRQKKKAEAARKAAAEITPVATTTVITQSSSERDRSALSEEKKAAILAAARARAKAKQQKVSVVR